ncbi:unnamed protein product [Auanema sp. JU1783]|nr:unnamed protein product [Auanema sp. JU1783]
MIDDEHWNAFRSYKRASIETPSLTQWMVTSLQVLKLGIFAGSCIFITLGACFSKLFVLLLSTNLINNPSNNGLSCADVPRRAPVVVATYLCLALVQVLPDFIELLQSIIRTYRGTKAGRVNYTLLLLESCRSLGLSILVFLVFPQLDIGRCVLLTACLPLISAIQQLMASMYSSCRPTNSFLLRMWRCALTLPHFFLCLGIVSSIYLWAVIDVPFTAKLALPCGVILSSIGLWESWIGPQHEGTLFHPLYQAKYGIRKLNPSTRIAHAFVRIFCVISLMIIATDSEFDSSYISKIITNHSFKFYHTRLIGLTIAVCVLHSILRGCSRFLSTMDMRILSAVHPMTAAPVILYAFIKYSCLKSACGLPKIFSLFGLRWTCDSFGGSLRPFNDWYLGMIWLAVGSYRAWIYVRQRKFDRTDETMDALSPWTSSYCIEQSLVVFRRSISKISVSSKYTQDPSAVSLDDMVIRNDETNKTLTVYICATMWHETATEMTQMLRSILKLDQEHMRRQSNSKPDELKFVLEGHIYFDDAWCDIVENDETKRIPNEFFELFFKTLNEMTGEKEDENGRMASRVLVNTPYGGRVVIKLPAGTLLFVHLKDKTQIRHKKRWSQVMYMYYLLGHRIMDSATSLDDRQLMADNTFILAIDGDSKFEPEAVLRLLALMDQKSDIGCACGRIHPIGSGVMVWYQKFEYAIAHWFQKAAEHVFGCVLCAPGCFSLFRASALMDDNIMHKYTKTADQPRHFVQYDQGEDRWLSTLMLKQGYRIEYAAASDAETYAPEGFEEFFNQRRRWTPSSIANTIDLLADYKRAAENNNSISMAYIGYQFLVIAFSMLGPAIIFSMVVFAQVAAFGADSASMMLYNGVPIALFVVLCFTTESNVQLFYAKIMSIVYAFVMLAVLVATSSQIVLETVVSPTSMFVVAMVLIFFTAACLHPKEFTNVIYGTVFFLMIPSTYIFLTLYSLINLNVINWGTREAVAKATGKVENNSPLEKWIRKLGDGILSPLFPCFSAKADPIVESLERKLCHMEQELNMIKNSDQAVAAMERWKTISGEEQENSVYLNESLQLIQDGEESSAVVKANKNPYTWMGTNYLKSCDRGRLKGAEETFWNKLIETYLKPIKSTPTQQREIAEGLASLRNNVAFFVLLFNALLSMAIYLIQKHKNVLSIKWTPYDGFTWTKMNEMNGQFEETEDPLKIDPLGMGIIIFLIGILIVQTIGMLIHRLNTLIGAFQEVKHIHALQLGNVTKKDEDEKILTIARQMLDTTNQINLHAGDGYTRHTVENSADHENVLYKLQKARLTERIKRGALYKP